MAARLLAPASGALPSIRDEGRPREGHFDKLLIVNVRMWGLAGVAATAVVAHRRPRLAVCAGLGPVSALLRHLVLFHGR